MTTALSPITQALQACGIEPVVEIELSPGPSGLFLQLTWYQTLQTAIAARFGYLCIPTSCMPSTSFPCSDNVQAAVRRLGLETLTNIAIAGVYTQEECQDIVQATHTYVVDCLRLWCKLASQPETSSVSSADVLVAGGDT